jgi:hypothetical protein
MIKLIPLLLILSCIDADVDAIQADWYRLCDIAQEIEAMNLKNPEKKQALFAEKSIGELSSQRVTAIFSTLDSVGKSKKWKTVQKATFDVGIDNYQCPAFQKILNY